MKEIRILLTEQESEVLESDPGALAFLKDWISYAMNKGHVDDYTLSVWDVG